MAWGAGPAAAATIRAKDAHERGFGWGNHPSERKGAARRLNRPLSGIRNTPGEVNYPRLSAPRPSYPCGRVLQRREGRGRTLAGDGPAFDARQHRG